MEERENIVNMEHLVEIAVRILEYREYKDTTNEDQQIVFSMLSRLDYFEKMKAKLGEKSLHIIFLYLFYVECYHYYSQTVRNSF